MRSDTYVEGFETLLKVKNGSATEGGLERRKGVEMRGRKGDLLDDGDDDDQRQQQNSHFELSRVMSKTIPALKFPFSLTVSFQLEQPEVAQRMEQYLALV